MDTQLSLGYMEYRQLSFFLKKTPIVPKCEVTAQDFAVDIVRGLLQVHKTHGDLISKDS